MDDAGSDDDVDYVDGPDDAIDYVGRPDDAGPGCRLHPESSEVHPQAEILPVRRVRTGREVGRDWSH